MTIDSCVFSSMLGPLYSHGRRTRYSLDRRFCGHQGKCAQDSDEKDLYLCWESNVGRSVSLFTDLTPLIALLLSSSYYKTKIALCLTPVLT
jgi:hypothetical protein